MIYMRKPDNKDTVNFIYGYDLEKLKEYCLIKGDELDLNMGIKETYGNEKPLSPYAFADIDKIKFLKEKGFPFLTEENANPAFRNNILKNLKFFIEEFGFDINTVNENNENLAFHCNRYDTMIYLLDNDIDLMLINNKGKSLAEALHEDMFRVVFEFEPKIILVNDPLKTFPNFSNTKKLAILEKLKTNPELFDYNSKDSPQNSILFHCINDKKLLKAALELKDIDLEVKDRLNRDLLEITKSAEIAKILVENGKDFNPDIIATQYDFYKNLTKLTKKNLSYAFLIKEPVSILNDLKVLKDEYQNKNDKKTAKKTYF